jgi:hypothetical protein
MYGLSIVVFLVCVGAAQEGSILFSRLRALPAALSLPLPAAPVPLQPRRSAHRLYPWAGRLSLSLSVHHNRSLFPSVASYVQQLSGAALSRAEATQRKAPRPFSGNGRA